MSKLIVSQKELSERMVYLFRGLEITSTEFNYFTERFDFDKDCTYEFTAVGRNFELKVYKTSTSLPLYRLLLSKELNSSELKLELQSFKYGKLVGSSKVFVQDISKSSFGSLEILSVITDIKNYDVVQVFLKGLQQSSF
jgi:hypothetical protein